ncbi:hypothetical protein LCGC14_2785700 [marine sediment metagenome]|uniref:Uncharacterized protein n=1 Tax=marine sediment metagenome TaxID=412755 RepID=A0A0F8ZE34_9ZZZZ
MTETIQTSGGDIEFDEALHKYYHNGIEVPGVTGILDDEGFIDYSKIPKKKRDFYMKRGSNLHSVTELHDRNLLKESSITEEQGVRLESWKRFKKDKGFEIYTIESVRFNRSMWYCGTEDRAGRFIKGDIALRDRPVCLDLKGIQAENWTRIQTAGYVLTRTNWREWIRCAITFSKDGEYQFHLFQEDHDYRIFKNAVQNHAWKKTNGGKL